MGLLLVGCRQEAKANDRPAGLVEPVASAVASGPAGSASPAASASGVTAPVAGATAAGGDTGVPGLVCDPATEVAIPPTPADGFSMGRGDRGESDRPHRVVLTRGFCLDKTEVTVRAYKACVDAGKCALPHLADQFATYPRFPDHPVNMVNWGKARAYCAWAGKRLPTEAEWEWAATGPDGTKYPWGNEPEPECGVGLADFTPLGATKVHPGGDVGCFGGGPSAVGTHPRGAKHWPGGDLFDLAGNVWEWVEDSYEPYPSEPQRDPLVRRETANHALRGGGWNRPKRALQGWFRGSAVYTYQVPGLGFRCARGEPHPTPPPRQKPTPP